MVYIYKTFHLLGENSDIMNNILTEIIVVKLLGSYKNVSRLAW